jgi:hypothetical protein
VRPAGRSWVPFPSTRSSSRRSPPRGRPRSSSSPSSRCPPPGGRSNATLSR